MRSAVASVLRRGELGADLAGFRGAELGVEGKGLLPVVACLARVAAGVTRPGKAVVGAGLLVLVADVAGGGMRGRPWRSAGCRVSVAAAAVYR